MTFFTPTHLEKNFLSKNSISSSFLSYELEKIIEGVGVDYVTPPDANTSSYSVQCKDSVDFILAHLEEPLFPRDIMTKKLGHKIEVFDRKPILEYFKESDYQDCRISAYPRLTQYKGINLVAPGFIMIDLDFSNLGTEVVLDKALKTTLKRIYQTLETRPTVLWTGNGYHIYLPISAFVLEEEEVFARFQADKGPCLSTKFMRFAEGYFTKKKHDPQHRPSVNSCLLRVPGSFNSKNGQRLCVIQQWDGKKAAIQYMLRNFRRYLIQERLDEVNNRNKKQKCNPSNNNSTRSIGWIESLLRTPIPDHRKYCIWRILAPYLLNVRKLSDDDALSFITRWLEKCDSMERLTFNHGQRARYDIRKAGRIGYFPISLNNLRRGNMDLKIMLDRSQSLLQLRAS